MEEWTDRDLQLLIGALGSMALDVSTTKKRLSRGGRETNPLLGEHPSKRDIDRAGIVAGALGTAIVGALPKEYRRGALGAWIGVELALAAQNRFTKLAPGQVGNRSFAEVMTLPLLASVGGAVLAHRFLGDDEKGFKIGPGSLGALSIGYTKKF